MGLENMVKEMIKNLVISDIHIPYHDEDAVSIMLAYAKDYKPDNVFINGDLVDFYSLSTWDKNPERKENVQSELYETRIFLNELSKTLKGANIKLLEGNHENRLQRFMWSHPELHGMQELDIRNLLDLNKFGVEFVPADRDYWSKVTGHVLQGDVVIMHGDNRINGAKGGMNAAYNTMKTIGNSVIIGHTHRLSQRSHTSPYHDWVAIEGGSLCQPTGYADWQQGFVTFETEGDTNVNYQLHKIEDGVLRTPEWTYYAE